jgi:signal peptidase I
MNYRTSHKNLKWFWKEWLKPLLTIAFVMGALRSSLADWNDVPTGSMRPSIQEGDRLWVNKLAYDIKVPFTRWAAYTWANPKRGDIVVCFSPADGTRLVKRVVAIPGDQIELRDDHLWLNGQPSAYRELEARQIHYIAPPEKIKSVIAEELLDNHPHPVMFLPHVPAKRTFGPITVPEGRYFVMGDNRDNSFDSRYFGFMERNRIIGQATRVVLSVDRGNYYLPRWSRWFMELR